MRIKILIILSIIILRINAQNPRPLLYELERCNVTTALLWSHGAIDEYPLWSPDGNKIAFFFSGNWVQIDLRETSLLKADWLNGAIGYDDTEIFEILTEEDRIKYEKATKFDPRKIKTSNNTEIELKLDGLQTGFYVNGKLQWRTGGDNCHSLSLSPNQNYVAFLSEANGLMLYCINYKMIKSSIADSIKQNSKAMNLFYKKDYEKAEKAWKAIIKNNTSYDEPYIGLAAIEFTKSNDSLANEYLKKAIAINSQDANYYYMQSTILQKLNDNQSAVDCLKKYILLKPTNLHGYYELAELYVKMNMLSDACENYQLAKKYLSKRAENKLKQICKE